MNRRQITFLSMNDASQGNLDDITEAFTSLGRIVVLEVIDNIEDISSNFEDVILAVLGDDVNDVLAVGVPVVNQRLEFSDEWISTIWALRLETLDILQNSDTFSDDSGPVVALDVS